MNLRNKLFGNASIYLAANIFNAGIPFLLLPILTRILTPTDYGVLAMFGIVLSIFGAFTGMSVHGAISVRYFQLEKKVLTDYVDTCIGILVISTLVIFLLAAAIGQWLVELSGVPLDWILCAVVISGVQFLINIRLSLWQVAEHAKHYGVFQITQSLLNAGLSLIFIFILGMTWEGRVLGQTIAIALFGAIALWWLINDKFTTYPRIWSSHAVDALKFGVPLIPHMVGSLLIISADRLIIVKLLDVTQAGIYMVALQVGQVVSIVTQSFSYAYSPWLTKKLLKSTEDSRIKIVRGAYLYIALVFICATIFGVLAPFFLSVLVGESFQAAGELVIYIALGYAFAGCYYVVVIYIFIESKTKFVTYVTFLSGLMNILLMFTLVERIGLVGAGLAFMLANALIFIGTWWFAQKVHPMPWLKAIHISIK